MQLDMARLDLERRPCEAAAIKGLPLVGTRRQQHLRVLGAPLGWGRSTLSSRCRQCVKQLGDAGRGNDRDSNDERIATPRHRVWFRLPPDVSREQAFERVAALLLREKPPGTALLSLSLYPPGEGANAGDPRTATFMWELQFFVDASEGRDWDWGHNVNEALAGKLRSVLAGDTRA